LHNVKVQDTRPAIPGSPVRVQRVPRSSEQSHERHLGDTSKITKKIKQQNGSGDSKKKINVSPHAKVVEFRRVCGEHLRKGRHCVVTWRNTGERGFLGWEILVAWRTYAW